VSGPPENVEASELWLAITSLPRPHRVVPFPRTLPQSDEPVGELAIWPLTQEEQMAANAEADRFTKKLLKDPQRKEETNLGYEHTYANEVAVQVLYRACRDAKDIQKPAFPSPTSIRAKLSTDEVGVLFSNYTTVQFEVGPIVASMSSEEREAWILRLEEAGSTFPLDSLSWEEKRVLLPFMASRLVDCWTAMCSLGKPPDVSPAVREILEERIARAKAEADALAAADGDATSSSTPLP
jgi:hypothetical protein